MNFEEEFKCWTLDKKVEWALGPYICNLSENMRSVIVDLKAENERLKAELKQTEFQDQVVIDTLRNENERLKGENEKIEAESQKAFDVLTESVKAVCKEYEKMKCLALHAISKYCFSQGTIIHTKLELTEQPIEEDSKMIHKVNIRDRWGDFFYKAYRKAKKELKEGK